MAANRKPIALLTDGGAVAEIIYDGFLAGTFAID